MHPGNPLIIAAIANNRNCSPGGSASCWCGEASCCSGEMTVDAVTGGSIQALCDARQLGVIDWDLAHLPCAAQHNAFSTHASLR